MTQQSTNIKKLENSTIFYAQIACVGFNNDCRGEPQTILIRVSLWDLRLLINFLLCYPLIYPELTKQSQRPCLKLRHSCYYHFYFPFKFLSFHYSSHRIVYLFAESCQFLITPLSHLSYSGKQQLVLLAIILWEFCECFV